MKQFLAFFAAIFTLAASATNHQVQVGSNFYNPSSLTVAIGDTVTWTQVSGAHNVNGSLTTFPSNPAGFSSGSVAGGTWTYSFQFNLAGVYNYQCDPHIPAMVGTVTVTAGSQSIQAGSYTFGSTGNVASFAYNGPALTGVTASAITKNGFTSTSAANAFRGSDWPLGATNGSNTFTGTIDPTKYIEFTLTAASGQSFSNPKVRFDLYRSSTGPRQWAWRSSLNNFASNITIDSIGAHVTNTNGDLTLKDTIGLTYADNVFQLTQSNLTTVTFRLYGFNAEAATGTGGLQTALEFFVTTAGSGGGGGGGGTPTGPIVRTISSIRGVNSDGVADSLAKVVRLRGVVSSVDFRAGGYSFHLQDATGGIVVYRSADLSNYTSPLRGDSLEVFGVLGQFNGLLQLVPDTIHLRAQNRPLPIPLVVTSLTEANEGKIVRMNGLTVTTWPSTWSGSGQNITLSDGTNTFAMRVVPLSGVWNRPQPTGTISVIGGLQQFDNSLPYTSGYQIFPRDTNDIIPVVAVNPTGTIVRTIGSIRGVNSDGVADSLTKVVRLRGVVSTVDFRAGGYSFHLQDATGGIVVFRSADLSNYTSPLRGDSLEVYGVLGQFNGLLQLVPDTIHLRAQNRPLPIPLVVTSLTEANEGKIVRMNGLTVTTWPSTWSGSGQNITLSDGTNTFAMRVVPLSGVWNRPQPTGTIDVIGGLQQFDNSLPYTSGYQIFPRDTNDIIPVVAVNPTIRFVGSSATKLEGAVTQTVKMYVQPHLMMAGSVSLSATAGAGFVFGSDATTTPALSGTTLTLAVPSMTDTVSFTINVLDDNLIEGPESAVFAIASASTGLSIGAPNSFTFTIADNDVFIPTYTLPQVKGVNTQFLPDSNGVMCKLQGTVLGVNTQTFATTGNLGFTIHDGSVGFGVFGAGTKNLGYTVNEGDVIRVIGVIGHFNGLAQINADSIVVISTNGALPSPVVITDMNESTESQLIRMNNVYVINTAQWTNAGSGFSVNVTNGPDTIQLRIDADVSDVYSAPCPVGTFDVVGIGGQFDNSAPHNSGYQFLPRRLADFIFPVPVTYDLAITEIMASSNDPNTLISDDWFEITNYGSSAVDLGGFSWDDNSWLPGTVVFPAMVIAPGEAIVVAQIDAANEAAFRSAWNLGPWVQVLVNEDFTIGQPGFSSSGDGVALFDTSSTPIEICRAEFTLALAGFSVEFDTACTYLGNSTVGVRGAYASTGSDVGSPGNQSIGFSENSLRVGFSPNPTNGLVAIRMPSVGEYQIVLRNLNGQILASQVVNADHAEINLSGLARGMYLVDVVSEAGHAIERIVRN